MTAAKSAWKRADANAGVPITLKMKTKTFNHNRIEMCRISKKEIDTEQDRYSVLLDCDGDNIYFIGFYKTEVLKDLIQGKGKMVEKSFINRQIEFMKKLMGINPALQNLISTGGEEKVFQIP